MSEKDAQLVRSWLRAEYGLDLPDGWQYGHEHFVKAKELFARAFERYLAEGSAPTPALQRVFENFKRWMLRIYRGITGTQIDVKMNDEITGLFDRWMGGREEAAAIEMGATTGPFTPLIQNGEIVETVGASTAREPWQMTRAEFDLQQNAPKVEAIKAALKQGKQLPIGSYRGTTLANPDAIRLNADGSVSIPEGRRWVHLTSASLDSLASRAGMELGEEVYHRAEVKAALDAGLPVPENVLAEYPDLIQEKAVEDVLAGLDAEIARLYTDMANNGPSRATLEELAALRRRRDAVTEGKLANEPEISPEPEVLPTVTATINHNTTKNGIEVKFATKPGREVINSLKAQGYRWASREKLWYRRYSPEAFAYAQATWGNVVAPARTPEVTAGPGKWPAWEEWSASRPNADRGIIY